MEEADICHITPLCDTHNDVHAQVLCRYHKKLLCLTCILDFAKDQNCSIIEIQRISGYQDKMLLECLVLKQMMEKKETLIDNSVRETDTIKSKLEQKIKEMHEKLTKSLNEMKNECMKSVDKQAKVIIKSNGQNKQRLDSIGRGISEQLSRLSNESSHGIDDIKPKLMKLKKDLMEADTENVPDGSFQPNDELCNFLLRADTSLGRVSLNASKCYDEVDGSSESYSTKDDGNEMSIFAEAPSNSVLTSSDEFVNDSVNEDYAKDSDFSYPQDRRECAKSSNRSEESSSELRSEKTLEGLIQFLSLGVKKIDTREELEKRNDLKGAAVETYPKTGEKKRVFPGIPFRKKGDSVYRNTTVSPLNHPHPKKLINRTVVLSELKQQFSFACKFSKLVYLPNGLIGLMSRVHNSFVLTDTEGNVLKTKTMIGGLQGVVVIGKDEVALLFENGHQVCKFIVSNGAISMTACFIVHGIMPGCSGFDFDVSRSQFAISSSAQLLLIDKNGGMVKAIQFDDMQTPEAEMATTYDFQKDCLYILNKPNKTLKGFSFKTSNVLWERKYQETSFTPRTICLYKDTICIACRDDIALILAEDGELIAKKDTKAILNDCLGMCVIDDVIIFTSNSDDFWESTKLAFIGI